jgi:hypothetical protein
MSEVHRIMIPPREPVATMTDEQWAQLEPFVAKLKAAKKASSEYDFGAIRIGGHMSDRERLAFDSQTARLANAVLLASAELAGERVRVLGA